jgi:hypothetical protein
MCDQPRNGMKRLVFWAFLFLRRFASACSLLQNRSDGGLPQRLSRTGDSASQGKIKSFRDN